MAQSSLITTTSVVKRYLIYFGIFAVVVIVLQVCINFIGGLATSRTTTPNNYAYTDPDYSFGTLTLPAISGISISATPKATYSADNILPQYPYATVNVYKVNEPREIFGSEDIGNDLATRFGFKTNFTRDGNKLVWNENNRKLIYDKVNETISFSNPGIVPDVVDKFNADPAYYQQQAAALIANLNLARSNLDLKNIEIEYLERANNSFIIAKSPNTAQYLKIKVHRTFDAVSAKADAQGNPLVTGATNIAATSYVNDILSSALTIIAVNNQAQSLSPDVLESVNFTDWEFNPVPGVYNLLTADQAWANIKNNQGSLKQLIEFGYNPYLVGQLNGQQVISFTANYQKVTLAYLEPDKWTGYIYPIYIFYGHARLANSPSVDNADFIYYTYALDPKVPAAVNPPGK